jgi:hypothetical protein
MKTLTIPVQDDVYRSIQAEAIRQQKSLPVLLRDFINSLRSTHENDSFSQSKENISAASQRWIQRLRATRATLGAQSAGGSSTQEILDDLRSDRC